MSQKMPKRREDLELTELESESVCYVPGRGEGLFLNDTATLVLKHCDGKTDRSAVVQRLGTEDQKAGEDLLALTLAELEQQDLLLGSPGQTLSRSDFLRKWTVAAALPLISVITLPSPAQAQSCGTCGPCLSCGTCTSCTACITCGTNPCV